MNRDKVLELAQRAGFNWPEISTTTIEERLERFAALIEAETRVQTEQDHIDAECFRFWVREAASNPVGMAQLISRCVTEQEYRDAIIPCVEKAKAVIATAKGAGL